MTYRISLRQMSRYSGEFQVTVCGITVFHSQDAREIRGPNAFKTRHKCTCHETSLSVTRQTCTWNYPGIAKPAFWGFFPNLCFAPRIPAVFVIAVLSLISAYPALNPLACGRLSCLRRCESAQSYLTNKQIQIWTPGSELELQVQMTEKRSHQN